MDLFKLRREDSASEGVESKTEGVAPQSLEKLLEETGPTGPTTFTNSGPGFAGAATQREAAAARSESVITEGCDFKGVVKSQTSLRVDGTFEGDVEVGSLTIGRTGLVTGQCVCDTLFVEGCFRGKVECREVELDSNATVDGELVYSAIRVQRGAQITAKCVHKHRAAP